MKAKESIDDDLQGLNKLRKPVKKVHNYDVSGICVITQIDKLNPSHYKQVPFDTHPKKKQNINGIHLNVGLGLLVRETVRAAARFVPSAVGNTISGTVVGAATYGIGQARLLIL